MTLVLALQVSALILGIAGAAFLAYLFQQFSVGMYKPPEEVETKPPPTAP